MNRSFLILLLLVAFLGAGFGGSFVGGFIYGQSQQEALAENRFPASGAAGRFPAGEQPAAGRQAQRAGAAELTGGAGSAAEQRGPGESGPAFPAAEVGAVVIPDPTAEAGGRAAGSSAESPGRRGGFAVPGGLAGTIQDVAGTGLTLLTDQGPVPVSLAPGAAISQVTEAGRDNLAAGSAALIVGQRQDDGSVSAQAVIILPEAAANWFSRGAPGGSRSRAP